MVLSIAAQMCSILAMPLSRIQEHFAMLDDPRVDRTKRHELMDIVVIALIAVIRGADGWDSIVDFAEINEAWLRTFLTLPNGIPCADTFRRVFQALDPQQFGRCFAGFVVELAGHVADKQVCLDGKTMRRTFARERGEGPLHMVSAFVAEYAVTLGQIAVEAKSNEITAIPALLETIDVTGATVTIDAAGCQREIAAKIVDKGADYVLVLKGNQTLLHQEVIDYFDDALRSGAKLSHHQSVDKGHGRLESRRVWASTDLDWMSERRRWKGLRSMVMVERERQVGEQTSSERGYYLSSHQLTAERAGELVRGHWATENGLHWVLDVVFDEDHSRIRHRRAAQNFALLRKLALTLLKNETSDPRLSLARKRRRAAWGPDYLFTVLAASSKSPQPS
jgi:predicted transposase YbfD/YdcC